jgi:putative restriction endonuclease
MPHCVFVHKADSIYDDIPAVRYQFPAPYLARARQCVGDWVVYFEPVKVPRSRGYFAVARVEAVVRSFVSPSNAGRRASARLGFAP